MDAVSTDLSALLLRPVVEKMEKGKGKGKGKKDKVCTCYVCVYVY